MKRTAHAQQQSTRTEHAQEYGAQDMLTLDVDCGQQDRDSTRCTAHTAWHGTSTTQSNTTQQHAQHITHTKSTTKHVTCISEMPHNITSTATVNFPTTPEPLPLPTPPRTPSPSASRVANLENKETEPVLGSPCGRFPRPPGVGPTDLLLKPP